MQLTGWSSQPPHYKPQLVLFSRFSQSPVSSHVRTHHRPSAYCITSTL
uniref:Uncharacterized protein n=1 Tax=Anguilla anguilla TaxID=7936 RepID=A0A0E9QJ95_ANGAN